jgi:hypothetical protein
LLLAWDFNQAEAEEAFSLGLAADPNASMLHWGIQQTIGPGANRCLPQTLLFRLPDRAVLENPLAILNAVK